MILDGEYAKSKCIKELLGNKVDQITDGFLSTDKALKRSYACCIASFNNEAYQQKDKARCKVYFR